MSELPTTTWGTESDANRIKKTYVKGFMDVSGGELSVHNTAFNIFNSDGSGVFRINPRKITVNDDTGQEVDISLSYLTFLNNLVPADGQAVSIPEKVKYIFTVGTETNIGKSDASSNFRVYGNTYVEQNLFVNMDASLNSNLYVKSKTRLDNDLSLNGLLFVSNDASLNGNLYVKSKTRLDNDLSLNGLLFVSNDASLNSNLYVKSKTRLDNDLSLNGLLFVSNDASLNSNLYVKSKTRLDNDLSLNGLLFVSNDASLNGNLYVKSKTRLDNDLSLNGLLFVSNDASLNSNLYVKSKTRLDNDLSLNGLLFVSNDASLNGNLYVKSKTRLDNDLSLNGLLFVSKDVSLNSNLYVKSKTRLDNDLSLNGLLFVSNDASLNGNLYVNLKSYFGSDVSLNGKFNMYGDASVNGLLLVSNDASLNGNLYVKSNTWIDGDLSLNNRLFVSNDASLNGNLYVKSNTWIDGDLSLNNRLFVSKDASLNGNLYVCGRTTFYEPSGSVISSGTSRGTLNLTHGDASGGSSILFQSVNSQDNDYAYIQYQENVPYAGQTTTESGLLTIGIENEITGVNRDRISLWAANGSGNVGVNTKFPNYNLDVNGTLKAGETTTGLIKVSDNDGTGEMDMFGIKNNSITIANASSTGIIAVSSNINLNVATLSVAANNNQSRIRVSIPIVLAAIGQPAIIYNGDLTITYSNVNAITILKNGSAYTTIASNRKRNWTTDTRTWTGWNDNTRNASAYFGNIDFFIPISTSNASADTYTIGLAITFSLNVNSPYFLGRFVINGSPYYTQSHTTNSVGTTYVGTDPTSFQVVQITSPVSGGYIYSTTLNLDAINNVDLTADTLELESRDGSINLKAGSSGAVGDILLKTYGTGDINITGKTNINTTGSAATNIGVAGTTNTITGTTNTITGTTNTITGTTNTIIGATNINTTGSAATNIGATGTTTTFAGTVSGLTKSMVGLGNVDNQSKATMFSSPAFTGTVTGVAADFTGQIEADSFNASSDYRIKTDVKSLDASFNIDVLKPVTYTNTRHGRKDVGFIAHEVQEYYPFLVSGEKDGEHMQSLNYIGLIGILTKEIQDLKRRLAETEAKVASVETNVRTIETKVEEVDDIIISVEDNVLSVKNAVRTVDDKVSSVENTVSSVENTVLLEQARLTICETDIALNKSAIKDLDERLQS